MGSAQACVIGGSGFLGAQLISGLLAAGDTVRALQYRRPLPSAPNLECIAGDASDEGALHRLLAPGSTVLNLAYLGGKSRSEHVAAARMLGRTCRSAGVRRLVHVSTAVVVGTSSEDVVAETTPCRPNNEYEATKLEIEHAIAEAADGVEVALLRPTAIFGKGGQNLAALLHRLRSWPMPARYGLACLHGRRRMNVVPVETVVEAARFLAAAPLPSRCEVFIISQDDDPLNNYRDIEDIFGAALGTAAYPLKVAAADRSVLPLVLRLAGRSNTNPARRYSSQKLSRAGFRAPVSLAAALRKFAGA